MEIEYGFDKKPELLESGVLHVEFNFTYEGKVYHDQINFGAFNVEHNLWKKQLEESIVRQCKLLGESESINEEMTLIAGKRFKITVEEIKNDWEMLEELKYIGPEMASALLDTFGNLQGVLDATREELIAISGIGEVNVDKIINELGKLK